MYTSFFGLRCKPFQLTPDPEFLLMSSVHKRALTYLNYGVLDNSGFILITGEVGTGKTTILRKMMKGLQADITHAWINNTRVTSEQLISMINQDFGLEVKGRDKTVMLGELTDFLIKQYSQGRRSMIIIDEAQNLSPDLLEEIRLLSNVETDKSKLLQIILVGQPELNKTLARPELRQLRQRISISCRINPLGVDETEKYIYHRLEVAGNEQAVEFEAGTMDVIHTFSRGVPRLINIVCDLLLLSAFVEATRVVSLKLVNDVVGELETGNRYWQDEIPEQNKSSENCTRLTLQEIVDRVRQLEQAHREWVNARAEREDILERLWAAETATEKLLDMAMSNFKQRRTFQEEKNPDTAQDQILNEIIILKKRTEEIERKHLLELEASNGKKKGLWKRLFS